MKNIIPGDYVINTFNNLNDSNLNYILIRNIAEELPNNLLLGKDIDILIKFEQFKDFKKKFLSHDFIELPHPHKNDVYLYGIKKFKFFRNQNNILFDLNFHLVCRSLDKGQWIPLDQEIQKSCWKNKIYVTKENFSYWKLGDEDEFIMLITRSIFDKKEFGQFYVKRILELLNTIEIQTVKHKMKLVFFNYTDFLLEQIYNKNFNNIITNYIKFRKY